MYTNTRVKVSDGLHVSLGKDGYWLDFTAPNGNGAGVNISVQTFGAICKSTIVDWIDEKLLHACPNCRGHGSVDTPCSGNDPSCPDCGGEGII